MIQIILDSSILRKFPYFNKPEYYLLAKLAELNVIKINIPDFVLMECCSAQRVELKSKLKTLVSHLDKIYRNSQINEEKEILKKNQELIEQQVESISDQITNRFKKFISDLSINILENKEEYGKKVINDYFEGNPPFIEPKFRKDIPDAFIYQSILDFKNNSYESDLVFICNDGNLTKAIKELDIETYPSLDDFFKSPLVEKKITKINETSEIVNYLKENIKAHEEKIVDDLKKVLESSLYYSEIKHYNIADDNNEAHIESFDGFNDISIELDELSVYLEDIYTVNFRCNIDASILYYYFKADYWAIDPEDQRYISVSDHNKHYFEATQQVSIELSGTASLHLDIEGFHEYEDKNDIFEDMKIELEEYEVEDII